MIAERAEAAQQGSHSRAERPLVAASPLRIAEQNEPERVDRLVNLAQMLLSEAEMLAGDKLFVDESRRLETLNIADGIDFFAELKRFEISLIRLALSQTGGHQAKAAKLLNIKPTTLNTKIKLYGIEY